MSICYDISIILDLQKKIKNDQKMYKNHSTYFEFG